MRFQIFQAHAEDFFFLPSVKPLFLELIDPYSRLILISEFPRLNAHLPPAQPFPKDV